MHSHRKRRCWYSSSAITNRFKLSLNFLLWGRRFKLKLLLRGPSWIDDRLVFPSFLLRGFSTPRNRCWRRRSHQPTSATSIRLKRLSARTCRRRRLRSLKPMNLQMHIISKSVWRLDARKLGSWKVVFIAIHFIIYKNIINGSNFLQITEKHQQGHGLWKRHLCCWKYEIPRNVRHEHRGKGFGDEQEHSSSSTWEHIGLIQRLLWRVLGAWKRGKLQVI